MTNSQIDSYNKSEVITIKQLQLVQKFYCTTITFIPLNYLWNSII